MIMQSLDERHDMIWNDCFIDEWMNEEYWIVKMQIKIRKKKKKDKNKKKRKRNYNTLDVYGFGIRNELMYILVRFVKGLINFSE